MSDKKLNFPCCPHCLIPMDIIPIGSKFDKSGEIYGGIFQCRNCGHHNLDNKDMLSVEQLKKYLKKKN